MSDFWRGFWLLPLTLVVVAIALAILVITWWVVSDRFLQNRFWREQDPIVGSKFNKAVHYPSDQAAMHLLARWAWGVKIFPGVRMALYVSSERPSDEDWRAAKDALYEIQMRRYRQKDEAEEVAG
ncbi:hypothetical protein ACLBYD_30670 [Rhodococcus sp. C26F]